MPSAGASPRGFVGVQGRTANKQKTPAYIVRNQETKNLVEGVCGPLRTSQGKNPALSCRQRQRRRKMLELVLAAVRRRFVEPSGAGYRDKYRCKTRFCLRLWLYLDLSFPPHTPPPAPREFSSDPNISTTRAGICSSVSLLQQFVSLVLRARRRRGVGARALHGWELQPGNAAALEYAAWKN